MFTGLIEETGTVTGIRREGEGLVLTVSASAVLDDMRRGDSICINGACQTVTDLDKVSFSVFVSRVTADITTLGVMARGARVNLERAMSHQSRFGGHIVQGHVDGTGTVHRLSRDTKGLTIVVTADKGICRYLVDRGSVAVDGVSLTVVEAGRDRFTLYLIPETISGTTLNSLKTGDRVNIEVDILAKYVERMMTRGDGGKDDEGDGSLRRKLYEEGFSS
ncbi:MAG: riboflavin synthase [Spirochaetes bacterium]|nr:riboflavin synthase [Spirochaetota bacterium]